MKAYQVQVIIGSSFEDLSIRARNEGEALVKARKKVLSTPSLKVFTHRYARYVI